MIEISVEVVTHFFYQHFLLITANWDETSILFKEHYRIV